MILFMENIKMGMNLQLLMKSKNLIQAQRKNQLLGSELSKNEIRDKMELK